MNDEFIQIRLIGNIAEKFGGKWIFGGSIGLAAVFTLLTPMAARVDYRFLIAIRVLIGFMSGPAFPSAAALWGKWVSIAKEILIHS